MMVLGVKDAICAILETVMWLIVSTEFVFLAKDKAVQVAQPYLIGIHPPIQPLSYQIEFVYPRPLCRNHVAIASPETSYLGIEKKMHMFCRFV
jgi:hypothetical protein